VRPFTEVGLFCRDTGLFCGAIGLFCGQLLAVCQHKVTWEWSRLYTFTQGQCNTLQHTAAHCSTLQHTAAHCSTLYHTAFRYKIKWQRSRLFAFVLSLVCTWTHSLVLHTKYIAHKEMSYVTCIPQTHALALDTKSIGHIWMSSLVLPSFSCALFKKCGETNSFFL